MKHKKELCQITKRTAAAGLALLTAGSIGGVSAAWSRSQSQAGKENQMKMTQSKFYCNVKALTPEERAHHSQLTGKLMAARKEIVEIDKGYEFQFSPQDVTLAELADWVVAESKCCPFFDFHIDLENEGRVICLRLTGEEGIKAFTRAEFHLDQAK